MLRPIETIEYKIKHGFPRVQQRRMVLHVMQPEILEKYFVVDGQFTLEKIHSTYMHEPRFQDSISYYANGYTYETHGFEDKETFEFSADHIEHAINNPQFYHMELLDSNTALIIATETEFFESILIFLQDADYDALLAPCYPIRNWEFSCDPVTCSYWAKRYEKTGELMRMEHFDWTFEDDFDNEQTFIHDHKTLPELHGVNRLKRLAAKY